MKNLFRFKIQKNINIHVVKRYCSKIQFGNLSLTYNSSSPIFKDLIILFQNIKPDSSLKSNQEIQLELENLLYNQAKKFAEENFSSNLYKTDPIIKNFFFDNKNLLKSLINNYKDKLFLLDKNLSSLKSKIMYNVDSDFLLSIIFGRLLIIINNDDLYNKKTLTLNVTLDLGKEIINKYVLDCFNSYKKKNKDFLRSNEEKSNIFDKDDSATRATRATQENLKLEKKFWDWKKENSDFIAKTKDPQLEFELGNILINLLIDFNFIKNEVIVMGKSIKNSILITGSALDQVMSKLKNKKNNPSTIVILPKKLPMIVPPKEYKLQNNKYIELGGYLLNNILYTDEIILDKWDLAMPTTFLENNDICNMVNKISSVPFKINENVLDFIIKNNNKYQFYIDPSYEHPIKVLKNKKTKISLSQKRELQSFNTLKFLEQNILGLAIIYSEVSKFYFPIRLDYRGRYYCVTQYLNYQGIELAKALLEFAESEKVCLKNTVAIDYLKIFGANNFGNKLEKSSSAKKVDWVNANLDDIINFENGILLNKAEHKMLFLAFCFEFKKYINALNNKEAFFYTNLPIQLDASVNGFQHLCMLIDDVALSKNLNLSKSTWYDAPNDFYTFIALKMQSYLAEQIKKNETLPIKDRLSAEVIESYKKIHNLDIGRMLIKRAIMTIPYNASALAIVNYIKESFEIIESYYIIENGKEKKILKYQLKTDPKVIFTEIDFQNIRKILNIVIFIDYPKLRFLLNYLKDIAEISNKLKIPVTWILPNGLIVNQQFYAPALLKLKTNTYSNNTLNLNIINPIKFNKNKQKIALMPNLVHSLDATSLCLVIVNYFKDTNNKNFFAVHDCFAVPCNKINDILLLLKSAYCILYSENPFLLEFDKSFRLSIINTFGSDAVSFIDEKEKLIVKSGPEKTDIITIKYPSINKVVENKLSQINVQDSSYILL